MERADTGTSPHLRRGELYRRARRISQLAAIVQDCTGASAAADLPRAEALLKEIAAICGGMGEEK